MSINRIRRQEMAKVFNMVVDESGIGVITFDVVGEAMNTWTEEAFIGFDRVMQELDIAKGSAGSFSSRESRRIFSPAPT